MSDCRTCRSVNQQRAERERCLPEARKRHFPRRVMMMMKPLRLNPQSRGEGDVVISTHTTKQCYNLQKTVLAEHLASSRSGEENHQQSLRLANEMPNRAVLCRCRIIPPNKNQRQIDPERHALITPCGGEASQPSRAITNMNKRAGCEKKQCHCTDIWLSLWFIG